MGQRRVHWLASWLPFFLALLAGAAEAQIAGDVQLQIRLRYSDGTAVTDETIILQRLPEEESVAQTCTTNTNGECTWYVRRGLYQVLFTRPLDEISALALAEGGLRGLGITVGDENIVYHFTFHSDDRVYFDASPEAAVPSPIIPVGDVLHGGTAPTPALIVIEAEPVEEMVTPEPKISDTAVAPTSNNFWRIILFIGGGLAIGGGFHLMSRNRDYKTTRPTDEETKDA